MFYTSSALYKHCFEHKMRQVKPKGKTAKASEGNKENKSKDKTVEEIYQKKTQLEHILLRYGQSATTPS